jgi:hypothetical protein
VSATDSALRTIQQIMPAEPGWHVKFVDSPFGDGTIWAPLMGWALVTVHHDTHPTNHWQEVVGHLGPLLR